jgi:unspecific monooxygenase
MQPGARWESAQSDNRVSAASPGAASYTRVVPPAPKRPTAPLPLWRLILQLRRNALATWGDPAYELDYFSGKFLGRKSMLLNAPAGIRHVLVDNHANYGRSPATLRILHPMIGDGLFLAEGAAWKHQRRLVAPAFAPRSLDIVAKHVAAVAGETVAELRARAPGPADLLRAVQNLTLEVAGRALFSQAMRAHGAEIRAAMEGYGRRLARPFVLDFVLPAKTSTPVDWARRRAGARSSPCSTGSSPSAPPPRRPTRRATCSTSWLPPATRRPTSRSPPRRCATRSPRSSSPATRPPRSPSSGPSTCWPWPPSGRSAWPRRQHASTSPRRAAPAAYAKLPVARAVVQEALRLYPPAYTIVRVANGPDTVMGEEVPAGALIVVSPWVLHRHEKLWHDPEAFDPSRFLPGAPPPDRFAYLPFGIGPRVCVGAQFALVEATIVLATMAAAFRIDLVGSRRVRPVGVVTTAPERAPVFRLVPRDAPPVAAAA